MYESETFWTTLAWLWDRPELTADAAFLTLIGVILILLVPARLARERMVMLAMVPALLGAVFLILVIAWPTGRPLPALAHGQYDVVQMKNTGASLFLTASSADRPDRNVYSWWFWEETGQVGWELPRGGTTPDFVDGKYRSVRLCVGSSPAYRTFITVCDGQ